MRRGEQERKEVAMLVLSRRVRESLWIDGRIEVKILGLRGGRVQLGIEAPSGVAVRREELAGPRTTDGSPTSRRTAHP
jgi:carbon storage regulator CsrA